MVVVVEEERCRLDREEGDLVGDTRGYYHTHPPKIYTYHTTTTTMLKHNTHNIHLTL